MSKEENSKQTSLWEDSHVNRSVSQENKKGEMTTDISGQKCLDSLKKSNPSSLLGRMCKALLTSKTAWYSDRCKTNWKVKVSKSNVSLFQLQASVLGTKGSESGLWLTPSTMDISQRSPDAMRKRIEMRKKTGRTSIPPGSLSEQVQTGRPTKDMREVMDMETMKMYPTPRASGQEDAETLIKRKGEKAAAQHNLTAHMQMFPTPTVGCEEGGEQSSRVERTKSGSFVLRKKNKPEMTFGAKLSDTMLFLEKEEVSKMYPTPSASCQMDVVAPPETVKQNKSGWSVTRVGTGTKFGAKLNDVVNKVNQPIKPGGKLNPTFVEFLMGFPENWTKTEQAESKVSETQSSHKWQESSGSQSKKFYRTPTAMDKGDNSFKYAAKILKGKLNRSQSKQPVQKTLSMDVAMEHLKDNEKFKMRPQLPPKEKFLKYLKENLDKKKLIEDNIIKKTTIDHWLRSDHCFAYPTVEYWNMIKPYLKEIKFDYQMTFEIESDWE